MKKSKVLGIVILVLVVIVAVVLAVLLFEKDNTVSEVSDGSVENKYVSISERYTTMKTDIVKEKNITKVVIKKDNTATVTLSSYRFFSDSADEGTDEYNKREELKNNVYNKERKIVINGNSKIKDVILFDNVSNIAYDSYGVVRDMNNNYYLVDFVNIPNLGKDIRVLQELTEIKGKDLKNASKRDDAKSYNEYIFTLNSGDSVYIDLDFYGTETSNSDEKKTIKIDDSKDYVYDRTNDLYNDVLVAYVNINSDDAKDVNSKLDEVVKEANESKKKGWNIVCNYEKYTNKGILSINQKYVTDSKTGHKYYTYNFNIENGKKISYEDAYKLLGYDSISINSKVKDKIDGAYSYTLEDEYELAKKSNQNYTDSVDDGTIGFFFDNDNKLNVVVKFMLPAGPEYDYRIFKIE